MEPIPLRALTVLLNRERMLSDPRFKGTKFYDTTIGGPVGMAQWYVKHNRRLFKTMPKSVESINIHHFEAFEWPNAYIADTRLVERHPRTICKDITHHHETRALSDDEKQMIYEESRGHDGCYKGLGLFRYFFDLCPPGQQVSIQIADEEPLLVDISTLRLLHFRVHGPKHASVHIIDHCDGNPPTESVYHTGLHDGEQHVIIAFPHPNKPEYDLASHLVVDMTRLQYGENGRGPNGESYFIGTFDDYFNSMSKVCHWLEVLGLLIIEDEGPEELVTRLRGCAKTVWEKWQNRGVETWCEWCGKPPSDFGGKFEVCGECEEVSYCSLEHQKLGEKLHKLTCVSKKKA